MRRPQFTLRALLVVILVVGAFLGGMAWQRELTGFQATKREEELEKKNRGLVNELRQILYREERRRKQAELQRALDNPTLPSSQRFLPQPHPTK